MKVKIHLFKEVEVEIDDPAVAELDAFWRYCKTPTSHLPELEEMVNKTILAVEQATGIPFGDENAPETISAVLAMDDKAIIEW